MLESRQIAPEALRPLRRREYDQLVASGAFDDERVELLCGSLVAMCPQGSAHSDAVSRLTTILVKRLPDSVQVRPQCSLSMSELSVPEPDLAVVDSGDYRDAHPTTAHLVVEVADTSLRKDRDVKQRVYAECGVREYWIVNLQLGCFEVYREPQDGRFGKPRIIASGESANLLAFPEVSISVDEVLGDVG